MSLRAVTKSPPPAVRCFNQVHDLMRVPVWKRDAAWWSAIRQARDETLEVLRGPLNPIVLTILHGPNVPKWIADDQPWRASVWREALFEVEAWSERLDRAYLRFATEQTYGIAGTA
jgi:hypothetical protein